MIFVAVVFLTILHATVAKSVSERNIACLYDDISRQFSNCIWNEATGDTLNDRISEIIFASEGVNKEELLSGVSSICGDEVFIGRYTNCAETAVAGCSQLASVVRNSVNEDLAVFCDNGAPAEWLTTVLQNGYLFNRQCVTNEDGPRVLELVQTCVAEVQLKTNLSNMTVISVLSSLKSKISQWFRCMVDGAPSFPDEDDDGVLECGSTWQNVVLTFALRISAYDGLGVHIGPDEIAELMAINMV